MTFLLLLLFLPSILSLECYAGFKYLAGQSVGTQVETCGSPTDFCYNVTAGVSQLAEIKMAGCSTTRCFLSKNKCISQKYQGHDLIFCCCNTSDRCNSKFTNMSTLDKAKSRLNDVIGIFG